MRRRSDLRPGTVIRASTDWLADEHAQRDSEREPYRAPRRYRSARLEAAARQIKILGKVIGRTGTDGDE